MGGGGSSEVLTLRKGGGANFSHAEGGGDKKGFGVVFPRKIEVLAILKGGAQNVSTL